jgi:hypothetical protein
MTSENFDEIVRNLCERRPFTIFTIELNGGERIEIDFPNALTFRNGVASFISPGGKPIWFDHDSVNKIEAGRAEATQA